MSRGHRFLPLVTSRLLSNYHGTLRILVLICSHFQRKKFAYTVQVQNQTNKKLLFPFTKATKSSERFIGFRVYLIPISDSNTSNHKIRLLPEKTEGQKASNIEQVTLDAEESWSDTFFVAESSIKEILACGVDLCHVGIDMQMEEAVKRRYKYNSPSKVLDSEMLVPTMRVRSNTVRLQLKGKIKSA